MVLVGRLLQACSRSLEDLTLTFFPDLGEEGDIWFAMPRLEQPLFALAPRLKRLSLKDALHGERDVEILTRVLRRCLHLREVDFQSEHAFLSQRKRRTTRTTRRRCRLRRTACPPSPSFW